MLHISKLARNTETCSHIYLGPSKANNNVAEIEFEPQLLHIL